MDVLQVELSIFRLIFFPLLTLCGPVGNTVPLYATKTGYDLSLETTDSIRNSQLHWLQLAESTGASVPEGLDNCTPYGVYTVYRHGTRYPSDGDLEDVHNIIERLRSTDVNPEFQYLRNVTEVPISNASMLADSGWSEMRELAGRLKNRFPELFPDSDVDLGRYSFQSTGKTRTIDSARGYIEGVVGDDQTCQTNYSERAFTVRCTENAGSPTPTSTTVPHNPIDNDPLLRFYDIWEECTEAVNGGRTKREQNEFRDGPEIGEVWLRVAQELAGPGEGTWDISREEVILLSEMCGYDRALYNDTETWCKLFELEDLYAPEYHSELKNYWNKAYGFSINYRISCTLAQDALNYLQDRVNSPLQSPLGNFKFAHSETIVPLVALLGLFDDPLPLVASNFRENINRTFRAAHMSPFAGNVAFALYGCTSDSAVTFRVQTLLNESPVQLDFCNGQFCSLEEFRTGLERAIGTCNFTEECAEVLLEVTTQQPDSGADITYSVCLNFLLAYVALIALSFTRFD
ncbi:multiple inositol polyphosphate phosphatase 1-like [Acanthaster planci]|uniref:Multiple inositol polyphosphate phosphatase 1 n=1 Tax=Acanthaster planci TaxID=133434 RepID=A0A8B7XJ81_ACAPL|nr:multiple inositol polyphosphate phosphatase 1-like [Acanthaster planci]